MSKILFVCVCLLLTVACHREEVIVIEEPQSQPNTYPQPNEPHAYPQPDPYYPPNETSGKEYFDEGNNYPDESADDWLNNSGHSNETSGADYFHEKNSQPNYSQPSHTDYHQPKKNETADDWLDNSGQVNETSGANYFDEKPKNNYSQPKNNYSQPKNDYSQPKNDYSQPKNDYSKPKKDYSKPKKDTSADDWLNDTGQVEETSGADFFGEDY